MTKHKSEYNLEPYIAVQVKGTQIEGERDGKSKVRDVQKWNKFVEGEKQRMRKEPDDK